MKFFAIASTALAVFSGLVSLVAGQEANMVEQDIKMLTNASATTQTMVSSITLTNVVFQGPKVAQTLGQIVQAVGSVTLHCYGPNGSPAVPIEDDAVAVEIVTVLSSFVYVHQQLLATIIGKHGLLSLFYFTQPIAIALRSLEGTVDTYAYALIALIPTRQQEAMDQHTSLMASLTLAIKTYSS